MSAIEISVVICTRNGAMRLPEVLDALSEQEGVCQTVWEIILVDNASTDDTKHVFAKFIEKHPDISCRYVYEPVPGQSAARLRAIREVLGTWICFVDDDNVLDKRYLATAIEFTVANARIGAFGGRSIARLSVPPPEWFPAVKVGLAIWDIVENSRQLKVGERSFTAGLVVNTAAARRVSDEAWIMQGRTQTSMVGGEDFELCLKLFRLGKEIWYVPDLLFEHVIPESRLQLGYLKKLFETFGATHLLLYPVYLPCHNRRILTMMKIFTSAFIKIPFLLFQSIINSDSKWALATRVWTYTGVIKYSGYAVRRLMCR